MAQVMNPDVKKDDTLDNIIGGLQIYSTVQDIRAKNAQKNVQSMPVSPMDAMQRRLDQLNQGAQNGSGQ